MQKLIGLINFKLPYGEMLEILGYLFGSIVVPLIIVYILSRIARAAIQRVYSKFWYDINKQVGI